MINFRALQHYNVEQDLHTIIGLEIRIPASDIPKFKELIHRGANLWPEAPAEIKTFADQVTIGHAQQDYFSNPHLAGKGKPLNADKA